MARRRTAVRLGIPALVVAVLSAIALWHVDAPVERDSRVIGTTGSAPAETATAPLRKVPDLLTRNAVDRQAVLDAVEVRERTSLRTFWAGEADQERVFTVLDPDVKRVGGVQVTVGARVTLIGMVRPAPPANEAVTQWGINAATAQSVADRGTFLHVTEIRPAR
jgi:hypothetical protein